MQKRDLLLTNLHLRDLNPLLIGWEYCTEGHGFGPAVRNYTLLHYVVSGRGIFRKNGVEHPVGRGEVFCILPGELTYYEADKKDPWVYRWLGFDGELTRSFAELPPVFRVSDAAARCFLTDDYEGEISEYRIAAQLFNLYGELFGEKRGKSDYARQVMSYVEAMYMQPIRVGEIASQLHLDRRYLSRVFRERTGQTVQEYILSVRMSEAKRFLSQGLSVGETAERCGYGDSFLFSKMFKRWVGISPAVWKKKEFEKNREKDL